MPSIANAHLHGDLGSTIGDGILKANILRRFTLASIQLSHATTVYGRARSGYYQAAAMFLASIVEALLHIIVEKAKNQGKEFPIITEYKGYTALPKNFFGEDVFVCRQISSPLKIVKNTDFKEVIKCCDQLQLIPNGLPKKCHKIRDLRNRIHLMGRSQTDRKYTKKDIDEIGSIIENLLGQLTS